MPFETLGLQAEIVRAVVAQGYDTPTPIQTRAIPEVLAGRDMLAGAQTGTGKTAAFAMPLLQLLNERGHQRRRPRALVLTPTRELAAQVEQSVRTYGQHLPLRSTVIFGGVGMQPQVDKLKRGVDIVVATPGRLLDHAGRGTLDLSGIEILVLDEADRMLDMGFIHDIRRVMKLLPETRQNLLFSATYTPEIERLATDLLDKPALIDVAPRNAAIETVTQLVYPVEQSRKRDLLSTLIHAGGWGQVLVFTRTKHGANRLAQQLERDDISAVAIHGNKSQTARTRALAAFKRGSVTVLVATDIAARGLDINGLPHVVNYEMPNVPEDYVHRIGRTGRAGAGGEAISLVCPEESKQLQGIQRLLKRSIEQKIHENFEPSQPLALDEKSPRSQPRNARNGNGNGNGRSGNGNARSGNGRDSNSRNRNGGNNGSNNGSNNNGRNGSGRSRRRAA